MAHQASRLLNVIYEDNHLLVVNKPAGVATMGAESGETVHSMAAQYLKQKYHKPGRAYVGVVSRLDAMTTGVLVLARTSKAAARLSAQFAARGQLDEPTTSEPRSKIAASPTTKLYLAAVEGHLSADRGEWVDSVRKDDRAKRMRVVEHDAQGAQVAKLSYVTLARDAQTTLVAIRLHSGRKHQVRLQFSDRGNPVLGDRKYGSSRPFRPGITLHSWRLKIAHPTRGESVWFEAELPSSWRQLGSLVSARGDWRNQVADALRVAEDESP